MSFYRKFLNLAFMSIFPFLERRARFQNGIWEDRRPNCQSPGTNWQMGPSQRRGQSYPRRDQVNMVDPTRAAQSSFDSQGFLQDSKVPGPMNLRNQSSSNGREDEKKPGGMNSIMPIEPKAEMGSAVNRELAEETVKSPGMPPETDAAQEQVYNKTVQPRSSNNERVLVHLCTLRA